MDNLALIGSPFEAIPKGGEVDQGTLDINVLRLMLLPLVNSLKNRITNLVRELQILEITPNGLVKCLVSLEDLIGREIGQIKRKIVQLKQLLRRHQPDPHIAILMLWRLRLQHRCL